ncbi:MAG: SsrA-binding protein SmpB [Bacteroidales bacterium]|nr:SsrA-binding protein SmpB [Bacteroidales bacterium]
MKPVRVNIQNKRAKHEYLIVDRLKAGIVLTGTEIKSIRAGKASLVDTFCFVLDGEMWVKNMYIAPYELGSYNNHASRRDRKLLLNRKEIRNLQNDASSPGYTIVPLRLFIDENGRAKLEIALCKGKREFDKRASLRERDDKREMDRIRKSF